MPDDQDLRDLVDVPKETLTAEYKSDLDLEDAGHRADLARHIAALANYGGGFVVVGFDNNRKPVVVTGDVDTRFHPDRISSVVHKYLEPPVLCDVVVIQSTAGQRHPVIRVPAHDETPVCAKADGPQDAKGRVQGIVAGRHYIREVGNSGPESVVITRPDQWKSLIRRLVASDRAALADMIGHLIDPRKPAALPASVLETWHGAAAAKFLRLVKSSGLKWLTPLDQNYFQLSYEFVLARNEKIAAPEMLDVLQRANSEMRDLVWTGWSMFYPFRRPEIEPYFEPDAYPNQGSTEVLETNLLVERNLTSTLPDFWRVSNDGKATIIRAYREDREGYPRPPGESVRLFFAAREIAEIVRHARAMAPHFKSIRSIRFRFEWHGLKDRQLRDPESDPSVKRVAKANRVVAEVEATPEDLTNAWPHVVAIAIGKLARAFDASLNPGADYVRRIAPTFRSM